MKLENLSFYFDEKQILNDFSLNIPDNQITCLLGPSGCGKTTLLNIVAGLLTPCWGSVECSEKVSCLFQEPRLFPWCTALENVSIPLKGDKTKAAQMLEAVGLKEEMNKYPSQLSGGMRQRVAIARAFSYPSEIILMDEPFQSLDVGLRDSLMKLFLELWKKDKKTVLWVTHSITEACLSADKIVCVDSNPMHIVLNIDVLSEKDQRNTSNVSDIYAKVYEVLTLERK